MNYDWLRHKFYDKKSLAVVISLAAALLFVGGLGGSYVTQLFIKNNNYSALLSSVKNTLSLEQVKFHSEFNAQKTKDNLFDQNLSFDGVYKNNAGLSAVADSAVTHTSGVYLKVKSKWIVDPADNNATYVNVSSYDTKLASGSTFGTTEAMNKMAQKIVDNNNKSFNNVWSKYPDALLRGTFSNTGVNGCMPKNLYVTFSQPQELKDLFAQLSDVLKIDKADSGPNEHTYTVTLVAGQSGNVSQLYAKSKLYKSLKACDPLAYAINNETAMSALKNMVVTIKVNTLKNIVSTFAVKVPKMANYSATLAPINNVDISIPEKTTDILAKDAAKQYPQFEYDFDHLSDVNNMMKYGACYNFDKYKNLLSAEVIKTCETLKKN